MAIFKRRDQTLKYASLDFYKIHFFNGDKVVLELGCVKMPNSGEISESSSLQHRNVVKRFLSRFPTFPNSFPTFPNIDFCLKPKAMCPVLVCQIPDAADAGWL